MSKSDVIEVEGVVTEAYPNASFEVELPNGHKVLAPVSYTHLDVYKRQGLYEDHIPCSGSALRRVLWQVYILKKTIPS